MQIAKIILKLLISLQISFLAGCSNQRTAQKTAQVFTGIAMTIPYRIVVACSNPHCERPRIERIIAQTFAEIDEIFNKWNPLSELSQLNRAKAHQKIPISPSLNLFFQRVHNLVLLTEGRFDPTVEAVQSIWKDYLNKGLIPPTEELEAYQQALGWHHIHIENGFFYKDLDAVQIDFSGIAKGYAVDLLSEKLLETGFPDTLVEWGGEIRAEGQHPKNRPWNIYISNLEDTNPEKGLAYLPLLNQAIATSGDYLQRWQAGDHLYSHVFNPKQGSPCLITEQSVASASVLAPSCFIADGLATAALTFSNLEEAKKWASTVCESHPDIAIWLFNRSQNRLREPVIHAQDEQRPQEYL